MLGESCSLFVERGKNLQLRLWLAWRKLKLARKIYQPRSVRSQKRLRAKLLLGKYIDELLAHDLSLAASSKLGDVLNQTAAGSSWKILDARPKA